MGLIRHQRWIWILAVLITAGCGPVKIIVQRARHVEVHEGGRVVVLKQADGDLRVQRGERNRVPGYEESANEVGHICKGLSDNDESKLQEIKTGCSLINIKSMLDGRLPTLIVFGATWCSPCKQFLAWARQNISKYIINIKYISMSDTLNADCRMEEYVLNILDANELTLPVGMFYDACGWRREVIVAPRRPAGSETFITKVAQVMSRYGLAKR